MIKDFNKTSGLNVEVYINPKASYKPYVKYVFELIGQNKGIEFDLNVRGSDQARLVIDELSPNSLPVAVSFYKRLEALDSLEQDDIFRQEPLIRDNKGQIDYLATIFYLVNCVQEYTKANNSLDHYERFRYDVSLQKRFDVLSKNLVQNYIDAFLTINSIPFSQTKRSRVFISHDIDILYGSFVIDGLWALKRGRLDIVLKIIVNEILRKPDWRNIDRVLRIQSEYDLRSTFFWLVTNREGELDIVNADYDLRKEGSLIDLVADNNFTNGLHKSSMNYSIDEELEMLPFNCDISRFHFLRFEVPTDWPAVSRSKLKFDASLGFAEKIGFRNSYGRPFQPFDVRGKKLFDFVEMPLHIMDTTLHRYMKVPVEDTADTVIEFLEKNKMDCVLSILWHNNYLTSFKYAGYLEQYKKVLAYLRDSEFTSISPAEIVQEFRLG